MLINKSNKIQSCIIKEKKPLRPPNLLSDSGSFEIPISRKYRSDLQNNNKPNNNINNEPTNVDKDYIESLKNLKIKNLSCVSEDK